MKSRTDNELIRDYVERNSNHAFAEIVRRYLGLVYSTCYRHLGERQMAEDTAQAVFIILARRARTFSRNVVLPAWLFDTCRLTAANARRGEARRLAKERRLALAQGDEAPASPVPPEDADALWDAVDRLARRIDRRSFCDLRVGCRCVRPARPSTSPRKPPASESSAA